MKEKIKQILKLITTNTSKIENYFLYIELNYLNYYIKVYQLFLTNISKH